jgi:hypothetical protein
MQNLSIEHIHVEMNETLDASLGLDKHLYASDRR